MWAFAPAGELALHFYYSGVFSIGKESELSSESQDLADHPNPVIRDVWNAFRDEEVRMWELHANVKAIDLPTSGEIDRIIAESNDPVIVKHRDAIEQAKQAARAYVLSTYELPDPDIMWQLKNQLNHSVRTMRRYINLFLQVAKAFELPDIHERFTRFKIPVVRSNQDARNQQEIERPPTVASVTVTRDGKLKMFTKLTFAAIHVGVSIPELVQAFQEKGNVFELNGCEIRVDTDN